MATIFLFLRPTKGSPRGLKNHQK